MKISVMVCLTAILVLAIGASAPAISPEEAAWQKVVEAAKRERVVNVYTSILSGKAGVEASKAFKDKYGISLEFITSRAVAMVEKVKMEQKSKSYVADVFETAGAAVVTLKREGYLESVAEALPVLKEKDKFVYPLIEDPEAQVLAVMRIHNGFWMNTNLVKPEQEPKSYYDLLDSQWKGKLFLVNPLYSTAPDTQVVFYGGYKTLDEGYFVKLYKSATLGGPAGAEESVDKLARGEFAISGVLAWSTAVRPFLGGAPIKPLDLKEGNMFQAELISAIKNALHPNATKVFINWLLSKEGQLVVTKAVGIDGVRNDIPSVLPFRFKGPIISDTRELMLLVEERYSGHYMANLLGIKR